MSPLAFNPQNNHYVNVYCEMSDQGYVSGHVDLTCTDKIVAMSTGVSLLYYDGNNNPIGKSNGGAPWVQGCGPAPIFGAAHTTLNFSDQAPSSTSRIGVTQVTANDWGPIIGTIIQIGTDVIKAIFGGGAPTTDNGQPVPDGEVPDMPVPPYDPGPEDAKVTFSLSAKGTPVP